MAPAHRRRYLSKPSRHTFNERWRNQGLDVEQRAQRFRQELGAGALESYRLANDLSQTTAAERYTATYGGAITGNVISRWEQWPHGHNAIQPRLEVLERLATIYHTTVVNLVTAIYRDQLPSPEPGGAADEAARQTPSGPPMPGKGVQWPAALDQVGRSAVGRTVDGGSAVEVFGDDDLWRLARAMRASKVDKKLLDQMERSVLGTHQVYASLAPVVLFPVVQGRLRVVAELLHQSQPIPVRRCLCVLAGHLAGLRAWLLFDLGDHQGALAVYDQALEPAQEAGDGALCGWILGGKSLIPSYAAAPDSALEIVRQARHYAAQSTNSTCQAWLDALKARAHADMGEVRDYQTAQERANTAVETTRLEDRRHGMDFDDGRLSLSYYEGTSLATLRRPKAAQPVLQQALHVQGHDRLKARSIVLIALATTYVQQQEIEEACRLAGEALDIPPQQRIGPIAQRAAALRGQLERWRGTAPVKELDEQLDDLQPPWQP